MTSKFCPDCAAEVPNGSNRCLECSFPLNLETISGPMGVRIPSSQVNAWKRIATMLRRNGVIIQQKEASEVAASKSWWALPIFGLLFFLTTLIVGPTLVNAIWEAPSQLYTQRVDLNQPSAAPPNDAVSPTITSPDSTAAGNSDDISTDFLMNALKSSEEQRRRAEETRLEAQEFIEQQKATESSIREKAIKALVNIRIGSDTYTGTLLGRNGSFLVDRLHLTDAFEYEKRMKVTASGGVEQVTEFIKPMVSHLEGDRFPSDKVFESERMGLALLNSDLKTPINYESDFDEDLQLGATVWVAHVTNGNLDLIQARVTEGMNRTGGVLFWRIDSNLGVVKNGSPVFNEFGKLTGILFHLSGGDAVLSFRQLREKEPQLFQKIR